MPLSTITEIRDIVIIVMGIIGVVSAAVFLLFTIILGWMSFRLLRATRRTMGEGVPPILEQARETLQSVKGTAEFMGESAAGPVIRLYGMAAGAQRALRILGRSKDKDG